MCWRGLLKISKLCYNCNFLTKKQYSKAKFCKRANIAGFETQIDKMQLNNKKIWEIIKTWGNMISKSDSLKSECGSMLKIPSISGWRLRSWMWDLTKCSCITTDGASDGMSGSTWVHLVWLCFGLTQFKTQSHSTFRRFPISLQIISV